MEGKLLARVKAKLDWESNMYYSFTNKFKGVLLGSDNV